MDYETVVKNLPKLGPTDDPPEVVWLTVELMNQLKPRSPGAQRLTHRLAHLVWQQSIVTKMLGEMHARTPPVPADTVVILHRFLDQIGRSIRQTTSDVRRMSAEAAPRRRRYRVKQMSDLSEDEQARVRAEVRRVRVWH